VTFDISIHLLRMKEDASREWFAIRVIVLLQCANSEMSRDLTERPEPG